MEKLPNDSAGSGSALYSGPGAYKKIGRKRWKGTDK